MHNKQTYILPKQLTQTPAQVLAQYPHCPVAW